MSEDLGALYAGREVHLWVEDALTRDYLQALWDDSRVRLWVGAGGGLREVVEAARAELPQLRIFWLTDGDWTPSPLPLALAQAQRSYKLPRHEIENYLLDPEALRPARGGRCPYLRRELDADTIRQRFEQAARQLIPYVACLRTLHQLKQSITIANWPQDPAPAHCVTRVASEAWLLARPPELRAASRAIKRAADTMLSETQWRELFHQHHDTATQEVSNHAWLRTFPGKELLRHAWDELFIGRGGHVEADIARHVGRAQREQGRAPAELSAWLAHMCASHFSFA